MSEEIKKIEDAQATQPVEDRNEPVEDKKEPVKGKALTVEKALEKAGKGVLKLTKPIRANSKDVTELIYDFSALTAFEMLGAIDRGTPAQHDFRLSKDQGLKLFAAAAGKQTPELDSFDIEQRISPVDAIRASQVGTVFFNLSSRAEGISSTLK